jgi:hypothetical protein
MIKSFKFVKTTNLKILNDLSLSHGVGDVQMPYEGVNVPIANELDDEWVTPSIAHQYSTQPFRVLDLPPELCQTIWKFAKPEARQVDALRRPTPSRGMIGNGFDPSTTHFAAPPLLLVCRQISAEAKAFHRLEIRLNIPSLPDIDPCLGSLTMKQRNFITAIDRIRSTRYMLASLAVSSRRWRKTTGPEVAEETRGQLERYYSEVNNVPVIPDNFYTDYPASAEVGDAKEVSGSRADPIEGSESPGPSAEA